MSRARLVAMARNAAAITLGLVLAAVFAYGPGGALA